MSEGQGATMSRQVKTGLFVLGGILIGLVLGIAGGWLVVNLLETTAEVEPLLPLPDYDMEVVIEETYINRMMMGASDAIVAGNVDVQPSGAAAFSVQIAAGPFKPVVRGDAAFRLDGAGGMAVHLVRVKMGRLSLLRLIPKSMLDRINDQVNAELVGRVGSKGLEVVGVASDDTTLRLYLGQAE